MRILVFLSLVSIVFSVEPQRPAGRALYMFVSKSAAMARVPLLSSLEPCVLAAQSVLDRNESAVGALKAAKLFGLHDFRVGLRLVPEGSVFRLSTRLWYRPLRAVGQVSLTRPPVATKAMFSNPAVQAVTHGVLNASAERLAVEQVVVRPLLGATVLDVLTMQPLAGGLQAALARAYGRAAKQCVEKAARGFLASLNKVLGSVSSSDVVRGRAPVPLPRQDGGAVRRIVAFWRSKIREIRLDPLQVPIAVTDALNVTAVFRGLSRPPIVTYAGVDPLDKARTEVIVQYPVIGTDLDASLPGRRLRLRANVRDLMLNLQIANSDPPRVIDATDIAVNVPHVRNPRARLLRYILRDLKVFIGRDLGQFLVDKLKQA